MDATMTKDHTHVRIKRELWDAIKQVAEEKGMSGAALVSELMEDGTSPGYLLGQKLNDLQTYCSANESELSGYFEHDGEDNYGWLKDFIGRTLSEIENTESEADEDDEANDDYD